MDNWMPQGATPIDSSSMPVNSGNISNNSKPSPNAPNDNWMPQGATPEQTYSVGDFFSSLPQKFMDFAKGIGGSVLHGAEMSNRLAPSNFLLNPNDTMNAFKQEVSDVGNQFSSGGNIVKNAVSNPGQILPNLGKFAYNKPFDAASLLALVGGGGKALLSSSPEELAAADLKANPGAYMQSSLEAHAQGLPTSVKSLTNAAPPTGKDLLSFLQQTTGTSDNPAQGLADNANTELGTKANEEMKNFLKSWEGKANDSPEDFNAPAIQKMQQEARAHADSFKNNRLASNSFGQLSDTLNTFLKNQVQGFQEASNAYREMKNPTPPPPPNMVQKGLGFTGQAVKRAAQYFLLRTLYDTFMHGNQSQ